MLLCGSRTVLDLGLVCLFKCVIEDIFAKFEMSQGQSISQEEEIANWHVINMP